MPSIATSTFSDSTSAVANLKQTNGAATASSGFTVAPLKPSGALKAYPHAPLTTALGEEFDTSVRLREILALPKDEGDKVLRDLAILVSWRGVVFFKDQNDLVPEDLGHLALRLGELAGKPEDASLHIHPTQELSETGLPLGKISSNPDKDGRQISFADRGFTSKGWHSDVSFEPYPSLFTILKMHTLPKSGGDTLWQSNYHTYSALSPRYQQLLDGLTGHNDAYRFRHQARENGFKLRTEPRGHPLNSGDEFRADHPIVRTNQVTGQKAIYANPTFTTRINELSEDESRSMLDYLFKLQAESHDAHIKYKWSPHDLALWSNSAVNHLATWDFTGPREGDRAVVVGEKPYYDAASTTWNGQVDVEGL
ncbi:TauD/TfdA dioxygenase family protein [Sporobolomyces koalae]|uniref:TauD/TfdA dioxygenase family protein n=1 Tax=Sporobolomyces koalae TaxID=500713 RepID=UPI00317B2E88